LTRFSALWGLYSFYMVDMMEQQVKKLSLVLTVKC
jgi:hypothetical protein